ncbi:helix-turn-helix domain-containing protein [Streptomyces zingiberis]|uniref:Helix-turn-helix domain-containing protein n=1 Tax=Streptomyces zingiberis TaxID=2053010 RepID=A0ABX1BN16_9ACTN|nr:helix-turn-helix transcriptional regulator [Streptomyces zingiberis]NJP99129.1 helix-turn-helix domain-containing protein [Streptomyces zingiberis]
MAKRYGSSGTLRYFGSQMRLWRQRAGMSREELAEEVGYSAEMIRSVEQGRRIPQPKVIERVDDLLRADGMLKAGAVFLNRDRYPVYAVDFVQHEADAVSLCCYESHFIPGQLQTEGYARALLAAHCPPLDDETIEQRVAARLERQTVLTRKPPVALCFVIEEIALRRPVGGAQCMRDQLRHLLTIGAMRHVAIQVMPTDIGAHAGLNGPMALLETADHHRFAYVEAQVGSQLLSDPDDVALIAERYAMLRTQALNTEESARFIERVVGEL